MENKHAYLVLCHNNFEQVVVLLQLLDHENNDIYLHVDKKVKQFPVEEIKNSVKKSNLFFTKRVNVNWGGFSQIKAEMTLLKAAVKRTYVYYHLLSGACLPLHSQEYIHAYFKKNYGKEYLRVEDMSGDDNKYLNYRIKTYHFFQEYFGRDNNDSMLKRLDRKLQKAQQKLHINRIKKGMRYYYGDQWFSITHNLASYIVAHERKLRKYMRFSICVDELFMQTLVMSSPFADSVVGHCGRLIDWYRGRPYVFRKTDFAELTNSERLFARKFDIQVDKDIIEMIAEHVKNEQNKVTG